MIQGLDHGVELSLMEQMTSQIQLIECDSIIMAIQMKGMQVIHNKKYLTTGECQHSVEFQAIQVMTLQLRMIQFGAIANLIQVKFDGFK
jgi:hypothetical protein